VSPGLVSIKFFVNSFGQVSILTDSDDREKGIGVRIGGGGTFLGLSLLKDAEKSEKGLLRENFVLHSISKQLNEFPLSNHQMDPDVSAVFVFAEPKCFEYFAITFKDVSFNARLLPSAPAELPDRDLLDCPHLGHVFSPSRFQ